MKSLDRNCYNPPFSHIYVERAAAEHPVTERILARFPHAAVILIEHYKDVFCRRGQDYVLQHGAQNLILAKKRGTLLYEGAPVCQSFGNDNFYYTSCVMNCVYDCEYCYLKGMYPSGNLVIFVNLEDIFAETKRRLAGRPMYLCVSYDTDLAAVEPITGYVSEWVKFVRAQNVGCPGQLKIELRTKSADGRLWSSLAPEEGVICAFTLSPQAVIDACEHRTPSLLQRIESAAAALAAGFSVRLCFDPMIFCKDWKEQYAAMTEQVFFRIPAEKLLDVSVGSFRISQEYLKKMRRCEPDSAVVQFPFRNEGGFYQYPPELMEEMERYLAERLTEHMPPERIFRWKA